MEKMNDLKDLLKHEIQDLYSVEEQILEALPKMIDKATNKNLKNSLSEHLRITQEHKNRLDKIQQTLEKSSQEGNGKKGILAGIFSGKQTCKGMQGIIEEGNKIMKADISPEVLDAAIIAAAQKVEHYEICGYGTARTYARELGMEKEAAMLEQTLNEEYQADDRLTALAVQRINLEASAANEGGDRSGSGSARGRSGRDSSMERARQSEPALETASATRKSASRGETDQKETGKPKGTAAPRSSGNARAATPAKKQTSSGRSTKSSSGKASSGNGRSSSAGRGSSTGRGRK